MHQAASVTMVMACTGQARYSAAAGTGGSVQCGCGDGERGAREANRLRGAVFTAHQAQHAIAGEAGFSIDGCVQRPRRSARLLREGAGRTGLNTGSAEAAFAVVEIDLWIMTRAAFQDAGFAGRQAVAALVAVCEEALLALKPRWV